MYHWAEDFSHIRPFHPKWNKSFVVLRCVCVCVQALAFCATLRRTRNELMQGNWKRATNALRSSEYLASSLWHTFLTLSKAWLKPHSLQWLVTFAKTLAFSGRYATMFSCQALDHAEVGEACSRLHRLNSNPRLPQHCDVCIVLAKVLLRLANNPWNLKKSVNV